MRRGGDGLVGGSHAVRFPACVRPRPAQVLKNLIDHGALGEERENAHRAATGRTGERVYFVAAPQELGPPPPRLAERQRLGLGHGYRSHVGIRGRLVPGAGCRAAGWRTTRSSASSPGACSECASRGAPVYC